MLQHLVITAIGTDRPGICHQLTGLVTQAGCNIIDSKMALFGEEFSIIMLISGSTAAIARIESTWPLFSQQNQLMSIMKRTTKHQTQAAQFKVDAHILCDDRLGLTQSFTEFFNLHQVSITELSAQTNQDETGANKYAIQITGLYNGDNQISIQQAFMQTCLNLHVNGHIQFKARKNKMN